MVGKLLAKRLLTSEKDEIGSPTVTRCTPKSKETAVMTTMATNVAGKSFFKIGIPVLPSRIGKPKQMAVVQNMITVFTIKPPV
jgi:hypothetical protein